MSIVLPDHITPRWQQAHERDRLIEWRSFAFLLSAEAKLAEVNEQFHMRDDLLTLFGTAMEHVYRLQPVREEA